MSEPPFSVEGGDDAQNDIVWKRRNETLFRAWVKVRYHRSRQRFFDQADKWTKSASVVLSASLLGKFLECLQPLIASTIASIGLLALVFGYDDRKQLHKELAEQAANLIEEIEKVPDRDTNQKNTAGWRAAYARLCAKEPPVLKTLTLICEYEQSVADGHSDHIKPPRWLKRLFRHFID